MIHVDGLSREKNPVDGPVELSWLVGDTVLVETLEGEIVDGESRVLVAVPEGATAVGVLDAHGNSGWLEL